MIIGGGSHNLSEPLVLEKQDSNLTIRAAEGGKPLLVGGTPINDFSIYQGEILKADVSALVKEGVKYRQLLFGGKRMILARYPNHSPADPLYGGWAFVDVFPSGAAPEGHNWKNSFFLKPQDIRKWAHLEDVELDLYTGHGYWNNIQPVKSIDPASRLLTLIPLGGYDIYPHSRFHFQNALEELDAPGEWFLDPRSKILYFWPPAPLEPDAVRLVTLDGFVQIKEGAKNIRIERLAFTGCNGTAINLSNAEDCLIAGCDLNTVGGYGNGGFGEAVRINGGKRNVVRGNDIGYVAGTGVTVSGGDRVTLTPANHEVVNNDIHHVGIYFKGASGVDAFGAGHTIGHNLIHDCPRIAVQMAGNNVIIEYNHLHHLCLETNDGSAIYTGGRDWIGGRGSVWRYNRVHDVVGCGQEAEGLIHPAFTFGLYPDDNAGGLDIIGNLVYRIGRTPIHMHNSRDCLLENNVFAFGGGYQFDLQGWTMNNRMFGSHVAAMTKGFESVAGQPAWEKMRGMELHPKDAFRDDGTMMSGNILRRNIMISNSPGVKYADVSNATAKWNTIDGNLVWNGGNPINIGFNSTAPDQGVPLLMENFESTESGKTPLGWGFSSRVDENVRLTVSDGALQADCVSGGNPVVITGFRGPAISARAGASYRVKLRIKSTEPTCSAGVFIGIHKEGGGYWRGKTSEIAAATDWREVVAVATLPSQNDPAWKPWMTEFHVGVESKENKGRIFIDDVRVTEAEALSEWASWQAEGWDKNSIVADPMFEDIAKDDYRLKPESPAIRKLGFQQLPIEKMGLIKDQWRR